MINEKIYDFLANNFGSRYDHLLAVYSDLLHHTVGDFTEDLESVYDEILDGKYGQHIKDYILDLNDFVNLDYDDTLLIFEDIIEQLAHYEGFR